MVRPLATGISDYHAIGKLLVKQVKKANKFCYAPYSKINVSAGLYCKTGMVYTGVNIENSSYSLSICAERSVIYNAYSNGERKFILMLIWSPQIDFITPCGACLQVICEIAPKLIVASMNQKEELKFFPLSALIKQPFKL